MRLTPLVIALLAISRAYAAPAHIGVAMAHGEFLVDHAAVRGTSTVFEGSVIATRNVGSDIQLTSGAQIRLAPGSEGRVYRDRLVLQKGMGEVNGTRYRVEALGLTVLPAPATRVSLLSPASIQVAAVGGNVSVNNGNGFEIARVLPGAPLEFTVQSGATAPIVIVGKLERKNGQYVLTDRSTGTEYVIVGENLEAHLNKIVEIQGTLDTSTGSGASKVLRAASVQFAGGSASTTAEGGRKRLIAGIIVAAATGTAATIAVTRDDDREDISR